MNDNNWKPADVSYNTPYLMVPDVQQAVDFYAKAFGMEQGEGMQGPGGKLMHASMKYKGMHVVMLGAEDAPWNSTRRSPISSGNESAVDLYLYNEDVDSLFNRAIGAGGKQVMEVKDEFWGDRIGVVEDPFGYKWSLATKTGELDESKRPKFD